MKTAISTVAATIPRAIQGASAPAVSSGLIAVERRDAAEPALITAAAAATTEASRIVVTRSIGRRGSFRSVRYQWPRSRPSVDAPRSAAPAAQLEERRARKDWRPAPLIQTSTFSQAGTLSSPTTPRRPAAARTAARSTPG